MKELAVVLAVALAVMVGVALSARATGAQRITRRPRDRPTTAGGVHDETPTAALPRSATPPPARTAPGAGAATGAATGASSAAPGEDDVETAAAVAVIDVADRVAAGVLTREEGRVLVTAIADGLPRGLHRGGPPLTITDVLGEVLRSIGEVTDLSRVDDADLLAVVGLARSDAPTLRADLAAQGPDTLYDAAVDLFALWAGGAGGAGGAGASDDDDPGPVGTT